MADDRAYRIQLVFDAANEAYHALVPELDIDARAETRAEAIAAAEAAIEARVEEVATSGEALPAPVDATPPEPAEVTLQLNGALYRELTFQAQRAELEVEDLLLQLIAQGVGNLEGRRPPRGNRNKPKQAKPADEAPEPGNEAEGEERARNDQEGGRGRGRGRGGRGGNRGGNRGGGGRRGEGYRPEMENQADFLAYVRDMEKGGGRRR